MKKIYASIIALAAAAFTLSGCSSEDPIISAAESDFPVILDPIFPEREGDEPGVVRRLMRNETFEMTVTVTPSEYTSVEWYIDEQKVGEGFKLETELTTGEHIVKVVATTTKGLTTYRIGKVIVSALPDDPVLRNIASERNVLPGKTSTFHGSNLDKVAAVKIGDAEVADLTLETDGDDQYLQYTVPQLDNGSYSVSLIDAEGNSYVGGSIVVSSAPVITTAVVKAMAGDVVTLGGLNLSAVAKLTVDGSEVAIASQTDTELTFVCPELAEGSYDIAAEQADGTAIEFSNNGSMKSNGTLSVSSKKTLWEGSHRVDWAEDDSSPNKKWNMLSKEDFAQLSAGQTLFVSVEAWADADYCKVRIGDGWWGGFSIEGYGEAASYDEEAGKFDAEFSGNAEFMVVLTQDVLDAVQDHDGFGIYGHGFNVISVSVK